MTLRMNSSAPCSDSDGVPAVHNIPTSSGSPRYNPHGSYSRKSSRGSCMELMGRRFGHIRVTEVVGQGGMGDVYAGYDEKLERKVALKVLNADQRLDEEARERLLREARALSKLDHPNICR